MKERQQKHKGSELHCKTQLVNLKEKEEQMEMTDVSATGKHCQEGMAVRHKY